MFPIDFRTTYFCYVIICIVNIILINSLQLQTKKRFRGTVIILISYLINALGNTLIFLRDYIPNWISITVGNLLLAITPAILLLGLERFVGKEGKHTHSTLLILSFLIIHSFFYYIQPNLNARILSITLIYAVFCFKIAILMLKKVDYNMRKITNSVGILFLITGVTQLIHVIIILQLNTSGKHYFSSGTNETYYIFAWMIINILVAYSIILMYNKRLILDINIQEEKYSKAFHAAPFIIMLSKLSDGQVFEINKRIQTTAGYHPNELINHKTTDLRIWEKDEDRQQFVSELNLEGKVLEKEYTFRKKSGELFKGSLSANIIDINNEQCIISVISDISDRKRAENKLIASETSLRELNSTKDKFFSIIAHDMKSPFNGILGFSELLLKRIAVKDYVKIEKYGDIIHKSAQRANNLLSNLMDWSRLQTGRMEFNPEYIEVSALNRSVEELLSISAAQKSITLTVNLPDKLIIYADLFMLETVLRNLISNAIKFTPKNGNVRISVEDTENNFVFLVEDSGVGIETTNIEKLFRIDENISKPGTENETGTGLGLILCNDFIKKHNGRIWVESQPGIGSKFYLN